MHCQYSGINFSCTYGQNNAESMQKRNFRVKQKEQSEFETVGNYTHKNETQESMDTRLSLLSLIY